MPSDPDGETRRRLKRWRILVFISTWLSYVGLYFCRKPFYIVKPTFTEKLGIDANALADIGTVYLATYTVGQFLAGAMGSWTGARRMVLAGMTVSIGCNVLFGAAASYWVLLVFMGINGLAQATGWSGNVGTMAQWTTRIERGTIMGLWATCYLAGGILANSAASLMILWQGWRWAFFGGCAVLGLITAAFYFMQRNRPEDVGLPPLQSEREETGPKPAAAAAPTLLTRLGWDREVLVTLGLVGGFYFCVKFIRYALWSWAPYFLKLNFGLESYQSGLMATVFDAAGFFGVMTAGVVSDRLFGGRRAAVAFLMLLGMTAGCLLLWILGARSVTYFTVGLGIVGFMLYGPDSLLSAAGAIDLGGRRGAIAAAGAINGMGAIGSLVQEKIVGAIYTRTEGALGPIFLVLLGASTLALLFVLVVIWRNRVGKSDL